LMQLLGLPVPMYRHHLLLRRPDGQKFSKSVGDGSRADAIALAGPAMCGRLAHLLGLQEKSRPTTPETLLSGFCWTQVATRDRTVAED
jgi:glutamyl/glutaminyl-tRNA synthetase